MAPHTRAELVAEIVQLQTQQVDDLAEAVFGGWTREQEAAHQKRADRLEVLIRELIAFDEISQRSA